MVEPSVRLNGHNHSRIGSSKSINTKSCIAFLHSEITSATSLFFIFSLAFSMSRNLPNFPKGSNTRKHPEEVNAQTGAQNAQTGAQNAQTGAQSTSTRSAHSPLPSSIAKYTTVCGNGIQVNDYGFMASCSTVSSLETSTLTIINNCSGNKKVVTGLEKKVFMPSNPSPNPKKGISIVKETKVKQNGIQVNDYGFMATKSSVDTLKISDQTTIDGRSVKNNDN
ncbi:hypothetical protein F0562_012360 [Nyssa sinensis]|uniref:Uncharacterized protein n=1 Tax=Nyssa sinensis TaxID=561372 RepID=A0A5J4ZTE6_9ASTE|nr:hypothetical protein F0562_012360 [Nyssa sinensis]